MPETAQTSLTPAGVSQQAAAEIAANHGHTAVGPGYRQASVSVRGGTMTVGLWGPDEESAPEILAVHGVSASHRSFGLLAAALPGTRIIAPDLRGRGRSNGLPGPYGMPVHADDLAAVLDELASGPVTLVGHSMGAFVSVVLAHRSPQLVSSAVLIDGGIPLTVPAGLDQDQVVQTVLGPVAERLAMRFSSVDEYREFWLKHPALGDSWLGSNDTAALMEDYITYDLEPEGTLLRPATQYEAMAQDTAELQGGGSLLRALEELSVPTRLFWSRRGLLGEEPGLYNAEYLTEWSRRIPAVGEQLAAEVVPETDHYSIVMAPDGAAAVADRIRATIPLHNTDG